jgi:cytochrome c
VKRNTIFVIAAVVAVGAGLVWVSSQGDHDHTQHRTSEIRVKIPELSQTAKQGQTLFDTNCAACHGNNAAGTKQGPPLIHKIYEPSHHGDASFQLAAKYGVRAHHWPYGNMPPVAGVTETEVNSIIAYVRELQRANGIR